jgi:hypothetical protein
MNHYRERGTWENGGDFNERSEGEADEKEAIRSIF